jgi:EmrB/QacA subfamily drug resistance transporter
MSVAATPTASRTGGVLAATCLSTLVVNANTSAVSILLPAISEDTGTSVETLQWAVTGYSLVGAAVIVTSGSLGDVFGRKRVFQLGLLLFVASCVVIALADSGAMVIGGRLVQGAAGATILACGLSLLSVANTGDAQVRAVSLWGAAAAVGAAAGPLIGGVLVDITGWQGLFWVDAVIAVACMALTYLAVSESRDPSRPRAIDYAGSVLVGLALAPLVLGLSKGGDWGWVSLPILLCLLVCVAAAVAFVKVEQRVALPLLDLKLLRNRILVGATIAILIGSGTINALMYLLSIYFQDPSSLGFSPLQAGLATLPATAGLVAVAPLVPRFAARLGGRRVIAVGFALTGVGFAWIGFADASWRYATFVLPLVAVAVGMGLSNGPASAAATAAVPPNQVGEASGVSNMARYVGASVATALAASLYASVIANQTAAGRPAPDALASGLAAASWVMAVFSFVGVVMAVVMRRHQATRGTLADAAAAAAATSHTLPTSASGAAAPSASSASPPKSAQEPVEGAPDDQDHRGHAPGDDRPRGRREGHRRRLPRRPHPRGQRGAPTQ